jgi:hypothetical protein
MILSYLNFTPFETQKKYVADGNSSTMIEVLSVFEPSGRVKHIRWNILKLQLFNQDPELL